MTAGLHQGLFDYPGGEHKICPDEADCGHDQNNDRYNK
jgi:hypothetical protein